MSRGAVAGGMMMPPVARPILGLPAGWRLIALPVVGSTQDVAREALAGGDAAALGVESGLVVWAGEQRQGRGRHTRTWVSPAGNLYVTIGVPCPEGLARATDLGFVAGVSLAETLNRLGREGGFAPGALQLKWPNDVLLNGAKVAGLLLESATDVQGRPWVLMGIGVNLVQCPDPDTTLYPTTALCHHWSGEDATGIMTLEPAMVLGPLLEQVSETVALWRRDGFGPVRDMWMRYGHGMNDPVRVRMFDQTMDGVFVGLAEDGALRMRQSDGTEQTVRAGDVFFPSTAGGSRSDR